MMVTAMPKMMLVFVLLLSYIQHNTVLCPSPPPPSKLNLKTEITTFHVFSFSVPSSSAASFPTLPCPAAALLYHAVQYCKNQPL